MPKKSPNKDSQLSLRIRDDVKAVLETLAEEQDRSLSSVVHRILEDYVTRYKQERKGKA